MVESSSDDDGELSNLVLTNISTTVLPSKAIRENGQPVKDSFKIWKPGKLVFKFPHAVHESIFLEQRMMRYGKLRIMFDNSLKVLFCEFNARLHEQVIPLKDR